MAHSPNGEAAPMTQTTFEEDIAEHVPAVQDVFAGLLEEYCGGGGAGITAISERLGVHRKLAWQIRNVAYSPDPFVAARFIPTPAGIETLLASLTQLGAPPAQRERLAAAAEAFESLLKAHAGDRASLEMLVDSLTEDAPRPAEEKWRERAFQGNSFIWGAQARTLLSASALNFSKNRRDWFDAFQVRGLIGLRRLRPNVHWIIGQAAVIDDAAPQRRLERTPLDPDGAAQSQGVPLMLEFCSRPAPAVRRRPADPGLLNDELLPAPVGFAGQQTIVTGEMLRELGPVYATPGNERLLFGAVVRTPVEVFIYDQFVHRGLFPGVERELCIFGELNSPITQDERDRLPTAERIEHLGRGLTAARSAEVPGYQQMLRAAFAAAQWDPEEFEVYRVRMKYPPMPASVVIRHELPPR